jgi:hypothetical protein
MSPCFSVSMFLCLHVSMSSCVYVPMFLLNFSSKRYQ